jgi:hypothetical protein
MGAILLKPYLYLSHKRTAVPEQTVEKKIHVRLGGDLHRRLRIRCAELELTIQDYVVRLLEGELRGQDDGEFPQGGHVGDNERKESATTRSRRRR